MDAAELTPSGGKRYCLVNVDVLKWVETFATAKPDSDAVVKPLLRDILPRWGIPRKTSCDNGTPFVSAALKQEGEYLRIELRQHYAYYPASGGLAVERENWTLKNKLSKCCAEMGLGWTNVLLVALMQMLMRERPKFGLRRPCEILDAGKFLSPQRNWRRKDLNKNRINPEIKRSLGGPMFLRIITVHTTLENI